MKWNERYKEYLTDESGLRGACEEIIFPSSSDELRDCLKLDLQFTIQGSRTGIMGGASPMGDGSDSRKAAILNLSRLQNIAEVTIQNNISYIRADAGAALEDIQARLRKKQQCKNTYFSLSSRQKTPPPSEAHLPAMQRV